MDKPNISTFFVVLDQLNNLKNKDMKKLLTEISNWCEKENMPSHWTIYELLEGAKLSRSQRNQLILFQKQLEIQEQIQEEKLELQTPQYPIKKRSVQWYIKEIKRLEEVDNQITLKVQHQLNVMDQKERCHGR